MYQKIIKELLNGKNYDPRHIEGYMRLKYGVLSNLSMEEFEREVDICIQVIKVGGKATAERNAKSFGL